MIMESPNSGSTLYRRLLVIRVILVIILLLLPFFDEFINEILDPTHRGWAVVASSWAADFLLYGTLGPVAVWLTFAWLIRRVRERDEAERYLQSLHLLSVEAAASTDVEALVNVALQMPERILGPVPATLIRRENPNGPWTLAGAHRLSVEQQAALQASLPKARHCHECAMPAGTAPVSCDLLPVLQAVQAERALVSVVCFCLSHEKPRQFILNVYLPLGVKLNAQMNKALNSMAAELTIAFDYAQLRSRELQLMLRVEQAIREQKDLRATLGRMLASIVAAQWAERGAVFLTVPDGPEADLISVAAWPEGQETDTLVPFARLTLTHGAKFANESPDSPILGFPLMADKFSVGALVLAGPLIFAADQADFLKIAIDMMALIIRNSQLYAELESQAVLEERSRVAREVHDGLAQSLGFVNFKVQEVDRLLARDQWPAARQALKELREGTQEFYAEVRSTIQDLRLSDGQAEPLAARLRQYALAVADRSDLKITVNVKDDLDLMPHVKTNLVRIVQEALSNVQRHAQATHVWVSLQRDADIIVLEIQDDGAGLPEASAEAPAHFGLRIIRERAENLGGQFQLFSQPGLGTRLRVTVPASYGMVNVEGT